MRAYALQAQMCTMSIHRQQEKKMLVQDRSHICHFFSTEIFSTQIQNKNGINFDKTPYIVQILFQSTFGAKKDLDINMIGKQDDRSRQYGQPR